MKLRNLNGAIRKHKGGVFMWGYGTLPVGSIRVEVVKSSLLDSLAAKFPDPMTETGLLIDADGVLSPEPGAARASPDAEILLGGPDIEPDQIDIDDVLGDGPPTFEDDDLGDLLG